MTSIGEPLRKRLEDLSSDKELTSEQIDQEVKAFMETIAPSIEKGAKRLLRSQAKQTDSFCENNIKRWNEGFHYLEMLIQTSLEAGMATRKEFLGLTEFKDDLTLGMLLRIHARGVRLSKEIVTLMKAGYPDGALSRWRSLYELGLTSLAIRKIGAEAAEDYYLSGKVKALEGMKAHVRCAPRMRHETFTQEEIDHAETEVATLLQARGKEIGQYNGDYGWLRDHVGSGKRNKVEEFLDLDYWQSDYKWASQDVHSGYREPMSSLALREATEDMLVVGPSNSGMTDPGHRTALCLSWITLSFINCYLDDDESPFDGYSRVIWSKLIQEITDKVGAAFLSVQTKRP
ncbi:MAG: DUF5677 domain-containing protein [Pseudomonadota bacterium]